MNRILDQVLNVSVVALLAMIVIAAIGHVSARAEAPRAAIESCESTLPEADCMNEDGQIIKGERQ